MRGGLRLELLTDRPERLEPGSQLFLDGEAEAREVGSLERGGRAPVITLAGIVGREAAEGLVGRYLEVVAAPLPEGEFYWHELEGLTVVDPDGAELGTLVEVFRAGGAEVYRIDGPGGELLVPAVRDVVRDIDLAAGRMVVAYESEEVR